MPGTLGSAHASAVRLCGASRSTAVPFRRAPAIAASTTPDDSATSRARPASGRTRRRRSIRTHIHTARTARRSPIPGRRARAAPPGRASCCHPPLSCQTHRMAQRFEGVIGDDWRVSTPWWPPDPEPQAAAPNVLLLVLDDVGFAQLGCYGSDIATPALDGFARDGIRLTNFHTTALCSPTRACLLTGRNHHRDGMDRIADLTTGYPGYWRVSPR